MRFSAWYYCVERFFSWLNRSEMVFPSDFSFCSTSVLTTTSRGLDKYLTHTVGCDIHRLESVCA